MIDILKNIALAEDELIFIFSRCGKPGGQNVNKVNSKAALLFDVFNSPGLSEYQKKLISKKLKTRINNKGILRVVSQKHRSQSANREEAIKRFIELLSNALREKPPRKKTTIPKTAIKHRLDEKKHRSRLKQERSKKALFDE
ncbi:MAG: aminoacyl-tRNA hydrolase [candidate division Zixibacteria bacterium]|nr:aminoacyl-tRNA hydrolase [candidate division Zixibacteria bacterium]